METKFEQFLDHKEMVRLKTHWTPFGEVAYVESFPKEEREDYCELLYGPQGLEWFAKYKSWCDNFNQVAQQIADASPDLIYGTTHAEMTPEKKQKRLVEIVSTWVRAVDRDEILDKNKASLYQVIKQLSKAESLSSDQIHEREIML